MQSGSARSNNRDHAKLRSADATAPQTERAIESEAIEAAFAYRRANLWLDQTGDGLPTLDGCKPRSSAGAMDVAHDDD